MTTYFFAKSWGKTGSGDGELNNPFGIAVDAEGNNVYIADTGNKRIQRFHSGGEFIHKWIINDENDPKTIIEPIDVAVSKEKPCKVVVGYVYGFYVYTFKGEKLYHKNTCSYVDSGVPKPEQTVIEVSAKGMIFVGFNALWSVILGYNLNTSELEWDTVLKGTKDSDYPYPGTYGISPDEKDNIFVCVEDSGGAAIQKYNTKGIWLYETPVKKPGKIAMGDGYIIGKDKYIFLADSVNKQILVFSESGQNLNEVTKIKWPTFKNPIDVAVDGTGMVYVLDKGLNQVLRFAPRAFHVNTRKGISKTNKGIVVPLLLRKTKGISKMNFFLKFNPNLLNFIELQKGSDITNSSIWEVEVKEIINVDSNKMVVGLLKSSSSQEFPDMDAIEVIKAIFSPKTSSKFITIGIPNPHVFNKQNKRLATAGIDAYMKLP